MNYRTKLLLAYCIPLVAFAVISMLLGIMQFRSALYAEKEGHLKSTALAAMSLYDSHGYGDYSLKDDGNVWRGMNFNVSQETSFVDDLKEQTGVDITFFFGGAAVMSSIEDADGRRLIGMAADENIKKYTLMQGLQLWQRSIALNGKDCQAYIIPIRQEHSGAVVGAMMASQSSDGFNRTIGSYVLITIGVMCLVLLAVFLFIRWRVGIFSQEFSEVTDKSRRDLLTGLYNKLSFESESEKAIAEKHKNDVSVLMILDFDNFKHINDSYGHQVGDEVLKSFGNILNRAFRTKDIIGRVGGDEFMVFMPDMAEDTVKRADEIAGEILDELAVTKVGPAKHFSCSIGIGTDAFGCDFKNLYLLADKALYEAKERGKACYVRYSSADKNPNDEQ